MVVKKKRKVSKATPVKRRRKRSRKRPAAGTNDHALKFINHYHPYKPEPWEPPRTEDYGVVPNLFQPITTEELEFQKNRRRRR